eukprot:TRINITY_DN5435_c0_g1_i2.p1 TRINITY_DN5435_c0_g1~~TRINITY_DN5435_c0_g1_i2.p1  ORF type:complete len:583 (-),score=73.36 TRINITY_DN5435_c0_g1_i2:123-1820(-)
MARRLTYGASSYLPPTTPHPTSRLSDVSSNPATDLSLLKPRTVTGGKDPRKVGDKAYTKVCIDHLSKYLETHGYEGEFNRKKLNNPTTNDFFQILNFLQRQMDPDAKPVTSDHVPQFFKRIRYPHQINPRLLVTVAAPHTWPHLVAALAYVVDVLSVVELDQSNEEQEDDWIAQTYSAFLEDNEQLSQQMEEEMSQQYLQNINTLQSDCSQIQQDMEGLNEQLEPYRNEPTRLEQANQQLTRQQQDAQKLQAHQDNLQQIYGKCQKKLEEYNQEIGRFQEQLQLVQREVEDLRLQVEQQPLTKSEFNRMTADLRQTRDILSSVQQQRECLEEKNREQLLQVEQTFQQLEECVRIYNQSCQQIKVIPETSKRAQGVSFGMRVNRQFSSPNDILNISIKSMESNLDQLRERYNQRKWELQSQLMELKDNSYVKEDELYNKKAENGRMQEIKESLEVKTQGVLKQLDQIQQNGNLELKKFEDEMGQMYGKCQNQVRESEEKLQAAQKSVQELQTQLCQNLTLQNGEHKQLQQELGGFLQLREKFDSEFQRASQIALQIHQGFKTKQNG